jgi:hypothetical protein
MGFISTVDVAAFPMASPIMLSVPPLALALDVHVREQIRVAQTWRWQRG